RRCCGAAMACCAPRLRSSFGTRSLLHLLPLCWFSNSGSRAPRPELASASRVHVGTEYAHMTLEGLLIILIVGAVAGWLAGQIVRGFGFGLLGIFGGGFVGAFFGSWLFGMVGFTFFPGIINAIITATIGAIILLLLIRVIKRA